MKSHLKSILIAVAALLFSNVTFAQHVHPGQEEPAAEAPKAAAKKPLYFCPMHPQITSDKPGSCPICHMDLQLAEDSGDTTVNEQGREGHVEHRAEFTLPALNQRIIGVKTEPARRITGTRTIRTFGRVASEPEAFTILQDYKIAKQNFEQMKNSPSAALREQAKTMLEAASFRLKIRGLDVKALESNAEELLLPKDQSWIFASVFQSDLPFVKEGQPVTVSLPYDSRKFHGVIERLNPVLDPKTRTLELRIKLAEPVTDLRPELFVDVEIQRTEGAATVVPEDAVLRSGTYDLLFVRHGEDHFVPREVKIGRLLNEGYEVLSGVEAGENVVVQANFFIDSESRLRATLKEASSGKGSTGHVH